MALRPLLRADYDHFLRLSHQPPGRALWRMAVSPRTFPVLLIRCAGGLDRSRVPVFGPLLRLLLLLVFRVEVPRNAQIGPGLVLPHPGGIVIGSAEIGRDAVIFQNVTLGAREFDGLNDPATRPRLGNGVTLGSNAVVLGPVMVGDGSTVAANSLVLQDVPAGGTAIGVPAKVKPPKVDPAP